MARREDGESLEGALERVAADLSDATAVLREDVERLLRGPAAEAPPSGGQDPVRRSP